jgi:hypothetical protein
MAITRIVWFWFRTAGNPNSSIGTFNSVDINMPPASVGAQVSLHGEGPGGTAIAGIRQYRRRLSSGADEVHDFGATSPTSWPPVIFDFVSSVSVATYVSRNHSAFTAVRLDFWN